MKGLSLYITMAQTTILNQPKMFVMASRNISIPNREQSAGKWIWLYKL
jgi:hypothetical protein